MIVVIVGEYPQNHASTPSLVVPVLPANSSPLTLAFLPVPLWTTSLSISVIRYACSGFVKLAISFGFVSYSTAFSLEMILLTSLGSII